MTTIVTRRTKAHFDGILCVLVYSLSIFGVLAVSNATFTTTGDSSASLLNQIVSSSEGMRQAIFLLISPVVLGIMLSFRYENLKSLSRLVYVAGLFLLAVALVTSTGGVRAWMSMLWDFMLQPAEFV